MMLSLSPGRPLLGFLRGSGGPGNRAGCSPEARRRRRLPHSSIGGDYDPAAGAARSVSVFTDARFGLDGNGSWAAVEQVAGAAGWARYAGVPGGLRLVARAQQRIGTAVAPLGDAAVIEPLPYYVGAAELAATLPRLCLGIVRAVARADTIILRLPGVIGLVAAYACRLLGRRYSVEVVGDPLAVLASGSLGLPGRLLAPVVGRQMRSVVGASSAALYVTETTLQHRYPARRGVPMVGVSGVRLAATAFREGPRKWPGALRIVTVGSQEVPYKGHDVLLKAVHLLRSKGVPVSAVIVGGGRLHRELVDLSEALGLSDLVTFTGAIHDREALQEHLDRASVFVMPSRTEGLPRALIEAMARGLPAVGSDVGGIPELLDAEFLVPAGDADELADRIAWLCLDPAQWEAQSRRNLEVARRYRAATLDAHFLAWLRQLPAARRCASPAAVEVPGNV